jgi:Uma2 family endonuclease
MIIIMIPWADICADRNLRDLPYKIETNRFDQIVMSPAYTWHGGFQYDIGKLLEKHMKGGRVIMECAVETTDGTKVPDVVWISPARYAPYRRAFSLPIAPEICVEVLSNSNSTDEMLGKMQLYFARGAEEVWLCDENGDMQFYWHDQLGRQPRSKKCPDFPLKIDWD